MKSSENSYRSILKGTSLFGGVQVFQILINLLRGKFVAIFLGPAGMGINALFNSALLTIQQFASLGLRVTVVREVAAHRDSPDELVHVLAVARRLIYLTALTGALVCALFAGPLSEVTFGDESMRFPFMMLGVAAFCCIAGNGLLSVLQGLHEVKRLGISSLIGPAAGLLLAVPLYWLYGDKAIVPGIVILNLATFTFYFFALRGSLKQIPFKSKIHFIWREHATLIKRLLLMGFVLMASDLIGSGMNYALNIILRYLGGVEDVGLYQAANSLTNQYCGVVFSAMAMDYFPRLSAAARNNAKMTVICNRQLVIVTLIITPLVSSLILVVPVVIRLLLTSKFLPITELMRWMGMGVMLRAIHYPISYITFAKDNKRVFFWLEGIVGNILHYGLTVAGYALYGLIGMGYAMVLDSLLFFIIVAAANWHLYHIFLTRESWQHILTTILITTLVFICSFIPEFSFPYALPIGYALMAAITIYSIIHSLRLLLPLLKK